MVPKLERFVRASSNLYANFGVALLLVILIMTFTDIVGSKFFNRPIPGSIELTEFFQILVVVLAASLTQIHRQHIRVEVFTARMPESIKAAFDSVISLVLFCVIVIVIWQSCRLGISLQNTGQYSATLHLGFHYFVYAMAFAFIPLCLVFLLDFLHSLRGVRGK